MKNLKIIATGDWHADDSDEKSKKLSDSLDQMVAYCENNTVDYLLIAGDLWERPVRQPYYKSNREGAAVELIEKYLTKFSKLVKYVVMCKGNNSHDNEFSIAILHQKYAHNIIAFEYPVVLAFTPDGNYIDLFRNHDMISKMQSGELPYPELLINLMSYPDKKMLMNHATDIQKSNEQYSDIFNGLMQAFSIINSKFTCKKIMGFHGEVVGGKLSNGQTIEKGLIISPSSLQIAGCDFYNLAHIHLHQWIIPGIMGYGGSVYAKDFGETEQKYFNVLNCSESGIEVDEVPLTSARPMKNFQVQWKEGNLVYEKPNQNFEAKVKFDIPENELAMLTDDKIEQLKKDFGEDVKIDKNIVRPERASRSEKIMEATTEEQEVEEWLNVAHKDRKTELGLPIVDDRIKLSKTMLEKISKVRDLVNKQEEVEEEVTENLA